MFVKGASEIVLESCIKWFDPATNRTEILTHEVKNKIEASIKKMA